MERAVALGVIAAIVATAVGVVATTGDLPDSVATKFALDGRAVGYMSREAYAWMMGTLSLVVPSVAWLAMTVLPRRWPKLVNIPFREYWLAPERRERTLARLARLGAAVALLTAAVMVVVHVEVIDAHRRVPPSASPQMSTLIFAIAIAIVVFVIGTAIAFRKPKDARR